MAPVLMLKTSEKSADDPVALKICPLKLKK